MASKRMADSETESKAPKSKRHRMTRTDLTSSQRGAFGDLGNATTAPTGDSDLDCEDDSEALAYLRDVRTQAATIPHVLVARKAGPNLPPRTNSPLSRPEETDDEIVDRTIYEDGVGDFRGYYEDGAYVAYPENYWDGEDNEHYDEDQGEGEQDVELEDTDESDTSESAESRPRNSSADEIRDAYFASITERYLTLRKVLQTKPPNNALLALPATNPTEVEEGKRGVGIFEQWGARLRGTDPLPAQIAAMHKDSVFRLLRVVLVSKFLRKRTQLRERTSRWIWALLARLPDMGELDYMEVGCIRELGKRAVLLMVSLAELELLRENYDVAGSSPGDQDEYELGADVDEYFEDNHSQDDQDDPLYAVAAPVSNTMTTRTADTLNHKAPVITNHEVSNASSRSPGPDNASDVEMQLDSDIEDGEVADASPSPQHSDTLADIEAAKARILAQLNNDKGENKVEDYDVSARATPAAQSTMTGSDASQPPASGIAKQEQVYKEHQVDPSEGYADNKRYESLDRAKVNERATLNMILTVAGEFYGQRDLLEFRDPFGGLQFE
ncbi:hypothetical protein F4861DRAFT_551897 [Xylaria intraflava]|nr:hypothetical protein F4861DRAFT_551897 [Xylaria intraflava]